LLFAMLTRRPPVPQVSGMETVRKVGSERPPQLSEVLEDVPRSLERTVAALHCFSPAQRMSSAAAAERQLESLLATAGRHPLRRRRDPAVPASVTGRLRQLSVRSRWMFVASLAALVTLLVVMIPSFPWPQAPGSAADSSSDRQSPDAVVIPAADPSIAAQGPVQTRPVDASRRAIELRESPDLSPASDNRALNKSPNDSPNESTSDMPRDVSNEVSHGALNSMPERAAASSAPPRDVTIKTLPFDDPDSLQLDELLRSIETQLDTLENR